MRTRPPATSIFAVVVALVAVAAAGCSSGGSSSSSSSRAASSAPAGVEHAFAVPAVREPLTTDPRSPVGHDNEVMALATQSGRLFAATDQWEYASPSASGQVLVKNSATAPWTVFEQTQSLRVQALDSFAIPDDQGLGSGHSLLITQAIVHGRSELQWLLDGANSFASSNSFALPSVAADVRAFGAHEADGVWSVYAGVAPTGVIRGTWSPEKRTLVFDPTPELAAAPPRSQGLKTQKVTGFADCAGALYVSINTKLFRRNDGALPATVPRWTVVYQAPPVGAHNSGLRGLTCITHNGSSSLLVSTEGNGNVYRLDDLPTGTRAVKPALVPRLEFAPIPAIRQMLAADGTTVPASGKGSILYVIAAYNNFETVPIDGGARQLFGFEWGYAGGCPATRTCGPTASGVVHFDAAACFAVRSDQATAPAFALHCLDGPDVTPSGTSSPPIRSGQAFVSIRAVQPSPFGDGTLYYGGYDCNFYPADGTAWIARSSLNAVHLDDSKGANP
jgi:hypothetical protein